MASMEQEYVNALQDFSKSLDHLVKAIQLQINTKPKDGIKGALSNTGELSEYLKTSSEKLEAVAKDTYETKTNTEKILGIVQSIKKEKKQGFFDRISGKGKDKTTGIAEGVKSIALMAGGILAIGLAFKVVGQVDFTSVAALSLALPSMAFAFAKAKEAGLEPGEALTISGSFIAMAVGVLGAGYLLKQMPQIGLMQMVSAIGVSAAMSVAMFGLAYAADKVGHGKIYALAGIALALPLIAWGITKAGEILTGMPSVGINQVLAVGGVGLALGLAVVPLALATKLVGNDGVLGVAAFSLIMPALAWGIVQAADFLTSTPDVPFMNVMKASLAISLSTAIVGGLTWVLEKIGMNNVGKISEGVAVMLVVSGGIMAASHILAAGDYSIVPPLEWTLGAGVSIAGFALIAGLAGNFLGQIIPGVIATTLVSGGIMVASHILAAGNYGNYPDINWALGVGASMAGFSVGMVALGALMLTGIGAVALLAGIGAVAGVAGTIVAVSHILKKGSYTDNFPSLAWAMGAGAALSGFAIAMGVAGFGSAIANLFDFLGGDSIENVAWKVVNVSKILKEGQYSGNYPSLAWALGAGASLSGFAAAMTASSGLSAVSNFVTKYLGGDSIEKIAQKVVNVSNILAQGNFSKNNFPTTTWLAGVLSTVNGFSEMRGGKNIQSISKEIDTISSSYLRLAASINVLAGSMNGVQNSPNLTFTRVMEIANSQSQSINAGTFAFNKDSVSKSNTSGISSSASGASVSSETGQVLNVNTDKVEQLLAVVVNAINAQSATLSEIADNTSKTLAESSNFIKY